MISVIKTYDSDVAVKLGGCDSCGCHEDLIHVAGQLTCSIQCTDELYAGVLDKKKSRAHTRGD